MSESCDTQCSGCEEECEQRDFLEQPHELSSIKRVVGIVSGKGGVGKSLVTSLLATAMRRTGADIGILDGDITGPSIPRAFGVDERATGSESGIFPSPSKEGIRLISMNLLLEDQTDPVIWRGPIIAGTVKQFWTNVIWGKIDILFVDMPPGTGDVPLTVFQSIPMDGIVVVTSPQELVGMIVEKAVKMADMMKIPVLGLVENMSHFICPDCGKKHDIFGESHAEQVAARYNIAPVCRLPLMPETARAMDAGMIENVKADALEGLNPLVERLKAMLA